MNHSKSFKLLANVLRVYGGGRNSARGFSQEVAATGNAGDIFTVGGWTNHFSKPLGDNKKHLSIRLVFIPASGSEADGTPAITWGEEWTGWQLTAGAVQAPINYSSIRFCIDYQDNVNYAEFDGMFLYKEQFGNTYEYNTDGSVTAITNMAQLKCNATYDDYNNMTSYTAYGRSSDVAYTQTWGTTAAGTL